MHDKGEPPTDASQAEVPPRDIASTDPSAETQSPDTDPGAIAAPPTSGWVVPTIGARPPSRTFVIFAWIAALLLVGFLARVAALADGASGPRGAGYVIGAYIAPFLVAFIARWVVVRLRRGRPGAPAGVLRSPWVPLGAIAWAALIGTSNLSSIAPPAPVDPATALRVGSGYTLRETDPDIAQQVADAFGGQEILRDYVIREVVGEDGSLSFLLIADGGAREADTAEMARGLGDGSGLASRVDTIAGKPVAVAVGAEAALASWVEEPLIVSVLAGDEPTLRAVVESILGTPRSG